MTGAPGAGPAGHVHPLWRKAGACDLHPIIPGPQPCLAVGPAEVGQWLLWDCLALPGQPSRISC